MTADKHDTTKLAAPTINLASVVFGLDAYLRSRNADATEALLRAGLEPADLTDPDRRAPLVRYLQLLEFCAELTGDPQFGLKFGAQYEPRHGGVVGNVALASKTLGEAFEMMSRYMPTMVDATVTRLDVNDEVVFAHWYYVDPLMMAYSQKVDWAIAFTCNLIRVGLGDTNWTPQAVLLPSVANETPVQQRTRFALMGAHISVGHTYAGIQFSASLLKRPMASADLMIESLMRHYGDLRLAALPEQGSELQQLRHEIARGLVKGELGIEYAAGATATSVRTLQRRLKSAGMSYSELLSDVRKTLALNLLQNETLALTEIAFAVGYSDVSAFSHAFRRWVGQTPGDYRRLHAAKPDHPRPPNWS